MTQDEQWKAMWHSYADFVAANGRCPSRHHIEEHRLHSWWKHNRKMLNAGTMRADRVPMFRRLMALADDNRHVNQYR